MKQFTRHFLFPLIVALCALGLAAQEHGAAGQATVTQEHQAAPPQQNATPENPNAAIGEPLAEASKEAAGEEEENAEFKQSASVKWFAKVTHLPVKAAYWLAVILNFAILAGIIYVISKSSIPAALRNRSDSIQKGIADARQASEEANTKLREVEARLAKLDTEVAQIKAAAETDFAAEELRIRQSAEEDARRVIEMAQQEIGAAAKTARRDLTAYAADLAVDLAAKKIAVTENDDRALVNRFVSQLGKDGK
jgi:F-type H+-transporting ATPase subunit b